MKPWLWLLTVIALVGIVLSCVVTLTGSADERIGANRPKIVDLKDMKPIEYPELPGEADPKPKAVVPESVYDFGLMDVLTDGEHEFVIRNHGEGNLVLVQGDTTCTCTISSLEDGGIVPPGGEVKVKLNWTTKAGALEDYRETAAILTNDAENPTIRFVIKGTVRTYLVVYPPVWYPEVSSTEETVQTVVLASATPDPFKITDIESTIPDNLVRTEIKPASPDALRRIRDLSNYPDMEHAWEVEVALLPGIRSGRFWEKLIFHTDISKLDKDGNDIGLPPFQLRIEGRTVGEIDFAGKDFERDRWLLQLNNVPAATGKASRLFMFVRGKQKDIRPRFLSADPDFLEVKVSEHTRPGVYIVDIAVPPGTAPASYMGAADEQGKAVVGRVILETDHPVEKELQILVQFAVEEDLAQQSGDLDRPVQRRAEP